MNDIDDSASDIPDLAQLLVLEAGRLLEFATIDFAYTLPSRSAERTARLQTLLEAVSIPRTLLEAALNLQVQRQDGGRH